MRKTVSEVVRRDIVDRKEKSCCKTAFLSGAIRGAGELSFTLKGFALSFRHTDKSFIDKVCALVNELTGESFIAETSYVDLGFAKGDYVTLAIPAEVASTVLESCCIVRNRIELVDELPAELVGKRCCKGAYLRGLFLSCGYLGVPDEISDWHGGKTRSGYSLEFNLNSDIVLSGIKKLIAKAAQLEEGKILVKKRGSGLYIKNADSVGAVIAALGSNGGVLALNGIIAERQMKNDVNRANNFDLANIDKSLSASEKQLKMIELIEETIGIDNLPKALGETCRMKQKYPNAGLEELGKLFEPPVSKSCINHRMRKLGEIADGIEQENRGSTLDV